MTSRRRVRRDALPAVTRAQVDTALAVIAERHLVRGAAYVEELSDDPALMLAHLRKRSTDFPADLRRLDYPSVVILSRWVADHEAKRMELWTLEQGKRLGMTNRQVGLPYGLISRQGVPDRIRTLRRLLHGLAADAESPAAPATGRPATAADRELEWLDANRPLIHRLAGELLVHEALADEDAAEWLVEVRRDLVDAACTPASFNVITFAVADMSLAPAVRDLDAGHAVWIAIREWRSLVTEHKIVTKGTEPALDPGA
jgi:hypothetical protein